MLNATDTLEIKITRSATPRLATTDFSNLAFGKTFSDHMFVCDYIEGEWTNFQILPYGELPFSPAISALHYGQAFFEGLKAYNHPNGKVGIFRPYKNAERSNRSAERLSMPTLPEEIFVQAIAQLVDLDREWIPSQPHHSLYIRPVMFATDAALGVQPSSTYKFVVLTGPTGPYFSKNLKVKIETTFSRASEGGFGFAKAAGNYAGSLLPAREAVKEGYDQLIWTDAKNHEFVEELGAANVMFVINGKLVTPSTRDTILKGITRDSVLTMARSWGVEVEERRISVAEVIACIADGSLTEAFGVGTAATIAHIAEIGHEGTVYTLPDVAGREISNRILKTLNEIRSGLAPDEFGWNYLI
ncbi:branched-chain amino acid aminotransferase [Hufsiella ginkgonis]|uniref:branched-chain-amino-acid transaminase n=1 Tax=Hufsiella ginkgonis TaxID=2695274 RepID=A0A7K1Y4N5_9SPHI|nr:branched-chain amino acid aminotransferase [Hufsiella ginkgonis]MXV17676.1 branched-chain amino acid aminotransferase [Hufsiella ginkgonis]